LKTRNRGRTRKTSGAHAVDHACANPNSESLPCFAATSRETGRGERI
jgi:hypothetical protein